MTTIFKVLPNVLIVSATQVSDRTIVLIKIMALDKGFELYEETIVAGEAMSQETLLTIPMRSVASD